MKASPHPAHALFLTIALLWALPAAAVPCRPAPPPVLAAGLPADNPCPRGVLACVDKVLHEMERRFEPLAASCDHDAVFSLLYLRTTEFFKQAAEDPGFFEDTEYVIREDVLFADYYFRAYDAWHEGRRDEVPPAWREAFEAAEQRSVSGIGDILLGMSAHINRDLPFVLAELGLTHPDGSSRKPDHDRVNDFLWNVLRPGLDEAARRFDPTIDDANIDGTTLDEHALFQLVVGWREAAWQNAVRLTRAGTEAERARVAREIEAAAAAMARLLRAQTAYVPPFTTTAARDAWCAAHGRDDAAPSAARSTPSHDALAVAEALLPTLSPAYPNPFNPQTTFTLEVPVREPVRVAVFDLLGRRVALLHDGPLAPGRPHRFTFEAGHLPNGVYLVRATGAHVSAQQQVTLLK